MASSGSGRGAGLLVFHDDLFGEARRAQASFTLAGTKEVFARLRYAGPPRAPRRGGAVVDFTRDSDTELYARPGPALGWETSPSDRSSHALTRLRGRIWGERRLGRLRAGIFGAADDGETSMGLGGQEPPAGLTGFSRRVVLGGAGLRLEWDAAPGGERPARGARLAAELEGQAAGDGEHGYARRFLDAQVFAPLLAPGRVLALRGSWERLHDLGARRAPFFAYPVLDNENRLRGYRRLRFRAPGAAAVSAEYRWPIWVSWDAFYFLDAAQSFSSEAELRPSRWSAGHGPGLRFLSKDRLLMTAHFAFTGEEKRLALALGKIF